MLRFTLWCYTILFAFGLVIILIITRAVYVNCTLLAILAATQLRSIGNLRF